MFSATFMWHPRVRQVHLPAIETCHIKPFANHKVSSKEVTFQFSVRRFIASPPTLNTKANQCGHILIPWYTESTVSSVIFIRHQTGVWFISGKTLCACWEYEVLFWPQHKILQLFPPTFPFLSEFDRFKLYFFKKQKTKTWIRSVKCILQRMRGHAGRIHKLSVMKCFDNTRLHNQENLAKHHRRRTCCLLVFRTAVCLPKMHTPLTNYHPSTLSYHSVGAISSS